MRRTLKTIVAKSLLLLPWIILLGLMFDGAFRVLLKRDVILWDSRGFGGVLRRSYHRQKSPDPPSSVPARDSAAYSWVGGDRFVPIAHALGPSLETGGNTLQTFQRGLDMGFRLFEVDISLTKDGHLICFHGDSEDQLNEMTFDQYLAQIGTARSCEFFNLVQIARSHNDLMFILDVKNRFSDVYELIRDEAKACSCGKHFIPQLYAFEQFEEIRREDLFAGEIFTSYRSALTTQQIIDLAARYGIKVVTLTMERWEDHVGALPPNVAVMVHPVDDPFVADKLRRQGVRRIYTSYLSPMTVPELFQ